MKKIHSLITTLIIILSHNVFSQSISVISAAQRTDGSMIVDIIYDLVAPDPQYTIFVEASFDNGASFVEIYNLSGDAGSGITPGYGKMIEWDYGSEYPLQYNEHTVVRVAAIPWICGNNVTDPRDGQIYPTVQIGNQCWMSKNMNIGTMVPGTAWQSDDGIIEKYCFDDSPANCATFGGFYQWYEMMAYSTTPGAQGICPPGWHVPTDPEWCILENAADSDTIFCNTTGWRGTDAGGNLKQSGYATWNMPNQGATNATGFTALGAGYRNTDGSFFAQNTGTYFWSSTYNWYRYLSTWQTGIDRNWSDWYFGYNVRCVKN